MFLHFKTGDKKESHPENNRAGHFQAGENLASGNDNERDHAPGVDD